MTIRTLRKALPGALFAGALSTALALTACGHSSGTPAGGGWSGGDEFVRIQLTYDNGYVGSGLGGGKPSADGSVVLLTRGGFKLFDTNMHSWQAIPGASYQYGDLSADGRVASFQYRNGEIVINGMKYSNLGIAVFDADTGISTPITVTVDGSMPDKPSWVSNINADGRFVVFTSEASNLVAGDTNDHIDVFLRDIQANTTTMITAGLDWTRDGWLTTPRISADGTTIAFHHDRNLHIYDRCTGTLTRYPSATAGSASGLSLSADGNYVVLNGYQVAGMEAPWGYAYIYVLDRNSGLIERVSVVPDGTQATRYATAGQISADGRFVAFTSAQGHEDAVGGISYVTNDVFVHDRLMNETARITWIPDETREHVSLGGFSADGRTLVINSRVPLSPDDTDKERDVFLTANPLSTYDPTADDDGDGLSNRDELMVYFTHYFKADSDGDGVNDGDEVANGTDPMDAICGAPTPQPDGPPWHGHH